jgi:chemotaxis protein CheX
MDANFVNPIIDATLHTIETTASITSKALKPYLKKKKTAQGDISVIIAISGDIKGSISISFTEEIILRIVSNMFGEEMKKMNDEIRDAVGEMGNMVSGQVSTKLATLGKTIKANVSKVLMGDDHIIEHLDRRPVIAMPYKTDNGKFTIEACFEA